jgi:hypothetical protein
MKNENNSIYYGILFLFIYNKLFFICYDLIATLILACQWNIYLIPVALSLLCIVFLLFFAKLKTYPKIKIWFIISAIIIPILLSLSMLPHRYLGTYSNYSAEDQRIFYDFRHLITIFYTYPIIIIAYIKYYKLYKQLKSEEMKNETNSIYYGILFYWLYTTIISMTEDVIILPIIIIKWNIYLIPIILSMLLMSLSIWFYKKKQFPNVKLWFLLVVFILSTLMFKFDVPNRFFSNGVSEYSDSEELMIVNTRSYFIGINTLIFLAIAYFKYWKYRRSVSNTDNDISQNKEFS